MNYQDKVNQSKKLIKKIKSLEPGEEFEVTYGVDRNDIPRVFTIKAYNGFKDEIDYTIREGRGYLGGSMNIEKITSTRMKGYTFDMMSNMTTYNFPLWIMKIYSKS
jgi:hypothetical protein|tara:strand:- start:158 stop:475 length:318 start_codon:yes stop_codon:yes gene_type:complete